MKLSKKNISSKCLICNAPLTEVTNIIYDTRFGIPNSFSISKCEGCDLEQLSYPPSQQEMVSLYQKYYNYGGEKNTLYTKLRSFFFSSKIYKIWLTFDGDISFHGKYGSGVLLDVGCNEGRGLEIFTKNGYVSEGLELNKIAAAEAKSKGFIVHTVLLEDFKPSSLYDVVVLSNVLEHTLDPNGMLNKINNILNPRGELWISCPNSQSWLRNIFGRYWINWHVPFHITQFSSQSIKRILHDSGFCVEFVKYESPALWVANSVIASIFAKRGVPTRQLRNPIMVILFMVIIRGILFPFLWLGNKLGKGDCIIVVAKKLT